MILAMKAREAQISISWLREVLTYFPESGDFYWTDKAPLARTRGLRAGKPEGKGYWTIGLKGQGFLAHRLAWFYMTGEWPSQQIDHINRVRLDNRWVNLREASNSLNQRNRGLRGLTRVTRRNTWRAGISINGKFILGGHNQCFGKALKMLKDLRTEYSAAVVRESDPREAVDLSTVAASDFDDLPGDE